MLLNHVLAACALALAPVQAMTSIETYADMNCSTPVRTINATESTGSGPCKQFPPEYSSFMVTSIGLDCGVTVYGNVPYCSSAVLELAELGTCYNATWAYYSVDVCAPPDPTIAPAPSTPAHNPDIGAIVGGTVAGVVVIGGSILLFWFRSRQRRQAAVVEPPPVPEYPGTPCAGKKDVQYSSETPLYEMSPQHIVEVHEDTSSRHELPS